MATKKRTPKTLKAKVTGRTVRRDADEIDETVCPIAKLARQQMALRIAHDALDQRARDEGMRRDIPHPLIHQMDCIWGRIDAIEEEASWHYAFSLRGVMFLLLLALSDLNTIEEMLDTDSAAKQY